MVEKEQSSRFLVCTPSRVVEAEKAKAVKGKEGTASDGEKDAHELLRTLVRIGRPPHTGLPRMLRAASFLLPKTRVSYMMVMDDRF